MNEPVARKIASLQRCVSRAREELKAAGPAFRTDFTRQDAAILNVLRACESAIDLANMIIRARKLGIPAESAESFDLVARERVLPVTLADRLRKMVGFRNIVVHEYRKLDLDEVERIIERGLDDLLEFARLAQPLFAGVREESVEIYGDTPTAAPRSRVSSKRKRRR